MKNKRKQQTENTGRKGSRSGRIRCEELKKKEKKRRIGSENKKNKEIKNKGRTLTTENSGRS